jgi:hypothetical protein
LPAGDWERLSVPNAGRHACGEATRIIGFLALCRVVDRKS